MKLGMVGLGRMGANMTKRLVERGHDLVVYDRNPEAVAASASEGATGAASLEDLRDKMTGPRNVWVMVPSGDPTRQTITDLAGILEAGDCVIDGGNSPWKDALAQEAELGANGVRFVDAGVSGGVWGLENGYCLMVGGTPDAVDPLEPIFRDLAPEDGYAHVGPVGAGHFV